MITWLIAPLTALLTFVATSHQHKYRKLQDQVNMLETNNAVTRTEITSIKDDISQVNEKLDKILDYLWKRK